MRADVQLLSSILLGSLSLIPNNTLRYTALGTVVIVVLGYNLYLSRTTQLHYLEQAIRQTEEIFERAKAQCNCPQDTFNLAQEWVRLLDGSESDDPRLKCNAAFWNRGDSPGSNIGISRDVRRNVSIASTIFALRLSFCQLILEAERQRQLDAGITEANSVLANARATCAGWKSSTFGYLRVNLFI
ncbi:hypothetical protein B0H19DRAFT_1321106 [Mycena capillaripes]|nr:hypothetical protein B0H19DRAFT_1321106 [Mycena capillaripes]